MSVRKNQIKYMTRKLRSKRIHTSGFDSNGSQRTMFFFGPVFRGARHSEEQTDKVYWAPSESAVFVFSYPDPERRVWVRACLLWVTFSKMAAALRTLVRGLNANSAAVIPSKAVNASHMNRAVVRMLSSLDGSATEPTSSKQEKFELSFEEFQKLRRKLRNSQRIAGLPFGISALLTSSAVSAYLNPNMFDATPEQIQPIL